MHYKYVSHVLATWQNIIVLLFWKCVFASVFLSVFCESLFLRCFVKCAFKVYFCYLVKHHGLSPLSAALEHHKLHIGWEGSNPEMGSNCIGLVHQTGLDWNEILISLLPQSTCKTFQDLRSPRCVILLSRSHIFESDDCEKRFMLCSLGKQYTWMCLPGYLPVMIVKKSNVKL